MLTARALLDTNGALTPDAAASIWRRYILDRGGAKKRAGRPLYGAIENLSRGMQPPLTGRYNIMNIDDGAAMRASPHGILWAGDPERAAASAAADACVSHDVDGIWAAQAIAAAATRQSAQRPQPAAPSSRRRPSGNASQSSGKK